MIILQSASDVEHILLIAKNHAIFVCKMDSNLCFQGEYSMTLSPLSPRNYLQMPTPKPFPSCRRQPKDRSQAERWRPTHHIQVQADNLSTKAFRFPIHQSLAYSTSASQQEHRKINTSDRSALIKFNEMPVQDTLPAQMQIKPQNILHNHTSRKSQTEFILPSS